MGLADFEKVAQIGRGYIGVVTLVRERATGEVFALKTIGKEKTLRQRHVSAGAALLLFLKKPRLLLINFIVLRFCLI